MEEREDLKSILGYLPVVARSSTLFWPSQVVETLKDLARGPDHSRVNSGEVLFSVISDLRRSLSLSSSHHPLTPCAADGYALFFDEVGQVLLKLHYITQSHIHSLNLKLGSRSCPRRNLGNGLET